MKALARWSAQNPVAANVLMALIFFGGYLAITSMRREMFPEFVLDFITVSVPYPGASPEEIEESICIKIEERIESVDGVKKILSTSSENVGVVTAELEVNADKIQAYNDIKNEIEQIFTFPDEAEEPVISTFVIRDPAIFIAIYGDASEEALRQIAADARDELTGAEEISLATMVGARNYEISIEVSEEALRNYGLSLDAVSSAVSRGSMDLPAGQVKTAEGDVLVRAKGQRYTGREYEEVPLTALPGGAIVRVGDVAEVIDGFEDEDIFARYDGKPAIIIQVFKVGSQDVLDVVEAAKRFVEKKRGELPQGVEIDTYYDFSVLIRDRINLLVKNGIFGLALVFATLWLFLRLRLAFWVAMGIPISFMGAFCLLGFQDATINMISLFAFIMTLGIVVDDAIIVGENIFTHYSRGASPTQAAIEGAAEVAWPVTNSILTSIVAFCPMFFVTGVMGKFIGIMPTVVIAVLLVSLFEAFLILPSHLQHSLANEEKRRGKNTEGGRIRAWLDHQIQHHIESFYTPFLQLALRYRYLTVSLAIAAVIVSVGLVTGGRIGFVVFPKLDMEYLNATIVFPQGTPAKSTIAAVERIEKALRDTDAKLSANMPNGDSVYEHMASTIGEIAREGSDSGQRGAHVGQVFVQLKPSKERPKVKGSAVLGLWRENIGEIAGIEQLTVNIARAGPGGAPIEVRLIGAGTMDNLEAATEELKSKLGTFSGVFDIRDDFTPGKWEMKIKAKPLAKTLGLTLADIARQVRQGFYGAEALRLQRGRDEVKVMVRYPKSERSVRSSVEQMRIRTNLNAEVPFSEVAQVDFGRGYSTIRRVERKRSITVTTDLDEAVANAEQVLAELNVPGGYFDELRDRYPGLEFDFEGQAKESRESIQSLLFGYIFALVAIFCLLAAQFRSYFQPVIIMCAIPLAITGAVLGHLIMGMPLTMISLFGIVALSGVVVNDSLVLIDFINRRIAMGLDVYTAVWRAGQRRFRAIILTSVTTVAGLLPLLLEKSTQAQFLIPMAVSLAFGLIAATFLTLVVTPSMYMILVDIKALFGVRAIGDLPEED